uniref:cysteine-rich receptor-like protein kinase 25 n=1 Tax=Erigeron canadensis TaxID=72917 RepID=UPI001CB93514|nr:cysteine-rich receptor-like protein kinase 25 [Erigeron canadensis]
MLILNIKLLIWTSFMFIYLVNTTTLAQPEFVSYFCDDAFNYTVNSTYRRNLDTALSGLPRTNSGFGFFNEYTGEGIDRVNAVVLCHGDVNPDVCRSCLNDSVAKLRSICPKQKTAIGYYDYCILQYSNQTILQQSKFRFYVYLANPQNASDISQFNEALRPLLAGLRQKAADGDPLLKFATGNRSDLSDFSTINALVQCSPDLSEFDCNSCLEDSINRIPQFFNGRIGGRILKPMCNLRYETYEFFNETTDIVSSPPVLQPSPPGTLLIICSVNLLFNGILIQLL